MGQQEGKPLNPVSSHPKPSGFDRRVLCKEAALEVTPVPRALRTRSPGSLLPNLERQGNVAFTV